MTDAEERGGGDKKFSAQALRFRSFVLERFVILNPDRFGATRIPLNKPLLSSWIMREHARELYCVCPNYLISWRKVVRGR